MERPLALAEFEEEGDRRRSRFDLRSNRTWYRGSANQSAITHEFIGELLNYYDQSYKLPTSLMML